MQWDRENIYARGSNATIYRTVKEFIIKDYKLKKMQLINDKFINNTQEASITAKREKVLRQRRTYHSRH